MGPSEPHVHYARTSDGVSIAFWTLGTGRPLLQLPAIPFSHIQQEWHLPEYRAWFERLAERRRLVRYDPRDSGLSDREVAEYSLAGFVRDIEAVVERLGFETIDLFAGLHGGPVAVAYAAANPGRVTHLVLWCTYARAADFLGTPAAQAASALAEAAWVTYTETVAHGMIGWAAGDLPHRVAAYLREATTQASFVRAERAIATFDVTDLLPQVHSPALVFHRRQASFLDVAVARDVAARLPNGHLVLLEGASLIPMGEESVLASLDEFLGPAGAAPAESGMVTILFTDLAGSTALTQRLGDIRAHELMRTHDRLVRDALAAHGGTEIKRLGDGFMASFPAASRALDCAVTMQRTFAAFNAQADEPLHVRVGLNAGEAIVQESDLFGAAVQLAARICAPAGPGEILVSNVVRELVAGRSPSATAAPLPCAASRSRCGCSRSPGASRRDRRPAGSRPGS